MMFPPCSDCNKVGLKRLGLYKNSKNEDVCDFHQYNPETTQTQEGQP